ncbi:MAG: SDR family oxidoreductase [Bacteroidota bacterium]
MIGRTDRILITGANGLLGQKLVKQCRAKNVAFLATSMGKNRNEDCPTENYSEMDICDTGEVNRIFIEFKPTHIIHTAAITNVDFCELNPDECQRVNVEATAILFEAAKSCNGYLIFLSTDFVFDGELGNYSEQDLPNPLSVYAKSKYDSEQMLQQDIYKNWAIVRTIIVYGVGNNLSRTNIICWAKDALQAGQEMKIVDDQFRAPTWADDLAWACLRIVTLQEQGVFHIAGPETMSIFNIIERVAKHFGYATTQLVRVSSATLNQPAKRPPKTGFDLKKSREILGYNPRTLEQTLDLL